MKRILLLDDNQDYLELLEIILGKKYVTRSCTDIASIPQIVNEFKPDLILIDHFLGLVTSSEVVQSLKSSTSGKSEPFILFSGAHDIEKRAAEIGAIGYISKPSSVDHIRKYIDDFFKYRFQ